MWFLRVRWDNLSLGPRETPAPTAGFQSSCLGSGSTHPRSRQPLRRLQWLRALEVPTPDQGSLLGGSSGSELWGGESSPHDPSCNSPNRGVPREAAGRSPIPVHLLNPQEHFGTIATGNHWRPCLFSDSLLVLSITSQLTR